MYQAGMIVVCSVKSTFRETGAANMSASIARTSSSARIARATGSRWLPVRALTISRHSSSSSTTRTPPAQPLSPASSSVASSSGSSSNSSSIAGGPLAQIIRDSIRATGPMPISRYMQFCLSHPTEGYYSKGDVFGRKGDFITSPEISQVFGEMVGIWLLSRWMAAQSAVAAAGTREGQGQGQGQVGGGAKGGVRLIELGPGRGTLMDDVLRVCWMAVLIAEVTGRPRWWIGR